MENVIKIRKLPLTMRGADARAAVCQPWLASAPCLFIYFVLLLLFGYWSTNVAWFSLLDNLYVVWWCPMVKRWGYHVLLWHFCFGMLEWLEKAGKQISCLHVEELLLACDKDTRATIAKRYDGRGRCYDGLEICRF